MSQQNNSQLFERAADMMAEYEGTILEKAIAIAIAKAMEDNELERLEYLVKQAEADSEES